MDGGSLFSDIESLSSLLGTAEADAQRRADEDAKAKTAALGPGDIGPKRPANDPSSAASSTGTRKLGGPGATTGTVNKKDIWAEEQAKGELDEFDDSDDDAEGDARKRPHYDILMAQKVGTGDVYLGMSGVTPLTTDCQEMVVKISLPNTPALKDISLDVKEQRLKVDTPIYKLRLGLPYKVKHKEGDAKWDNATKTLSVRLPVIRANPWD
jgi:PIH1 CS-like domain